MIEEVSAVFKYGWFDKLTNQSVAEFIEVTEVTNVMKQELSKLVNF
jgi:hypothetical protein